MWQLYGYDFCLAYNALTCTDTYFACSTFALSYCSSSSIFAYGLTFPDACKRYCSKCARKAHSEFCLFHLKNV